ncbi:hypothetical protein CFN78_03395 [Amycolatopsis antarctica]|uniref:Serine hydrolase n=1 Tax=Amycolatopsis antarctica TaxID=1854586 RepID=A0A263DCI5_9PSEU|nr:serine hydrolase [Amycolatopsis antarctica]OZM75217.1 hypothetical protein CFN78_03395 [Amycolatopsis antarctica]
MLTSAKNRLSPVGFVAVLVTASILLVTTVFFAIDSVGEDDWAAECVSAPVPASADRSAAIDEARQSLLRSGHEPVLGIQIVDLDDCTRTVSWKDEKEQPAASVVKLLIVLDLLDRSGVPSGSDEDSVRRMLSASDDTIASRLWQRNGGSAIIDRQAAALGLEHTHPPGDDGEWGATRMSPGDITAVYRHITGALPAEEREFVTEALADAGNRAADGFDQYFGIPSGLPDSTWAVKQGWGSADGRRVLNTTGLVTTTHTYAVAIMSTWAEDVDWPTATTALTSATRAMRNAL